MARLDPHPSEIISRKEGLTFEFEGTAIRAFQGDTIGSALAAAGVEVFSRSFKYHRPRGLLCVDGKCPNCLMNVNGVPNVRVCARAARQGDKVRAQHCWPSLRWDALSLLEKVEFLFPVGFYYKTLIKPRFLWRLAEPVIGRLAGVGSLSHEQTERHHYEHEYLHTDVAVIGGGAAGLEAAGSASEAGADVVLIDDQPELGGHLRFSRRNLRHPMFNQPRPGFEIARDLARRVPGNSRIKILSAAAVIGGYEGGLLGVAKDDRLIHLRAAETVVATGCYEYPGYFANNDLPGVMLGTGVRRLMHLYGVSPGRRAVVVTSDDDGLALALDLLRAGIEVVAVVDHRAGVVESEVLREFKGAKVRHLMSAVPIAALGRLRARSLRVAPLGPQGQPNPRESTTFRCDLVCLCSNRAPSAEILRQNGGTLRFDGILGQMAPDFIPEHFRVAGGVTGIHEFSAVVLQGRRAGLAAASAACGLGSRYGDELAQIHDQLQAEEKRYRESLRPRPLFEVAGRGKEFTCLCEDVTRRDVRRAVAEGFDEMELLKRYTTASMGPCQGRMCLMPVAGACAAETGKTLVETGTTTSRPPVQPVTLGALAGPHHFPVRLTPLHHKHVHAGARQMDMGEWKRPHTYKTPEEEWKAVRDRVGIIDVSTLGKLDLRGRDSGRLLDRVYTHVFSNLKVGRVRYGVICGDDGIILDDGTVSRLADNWFYITTTTGNIDFVEKWLNWWLAGAGLCSHVTNVTGDFAAINLAGPKAREVLQKLTDHDLSPKAFKYMECARAQVAGVPATLLRIGFVGETGWEIHYPACYGEYLWATLLEAGEEFGIAPFGVEAQRLLRLEKKHIIVGQDTDALSNPLEADMEWVVRFEKDDFIGKPGLATARARGHANKLVGFVTERLVEEGSVIVGGGKPVGRVTSARISPHLGRCVGLAWVPVELSQEGTAFEIQIDGTTINARVHQQAFYDPEGIRLKE